MFNSFPAAATDCEVCCLLRPSLGLLMSGIEITGLTNKSIEILPVFKFLNIILSGLLKFRINCEIMDCGVERQVPGRTKTNIGNNTVSVIHEVT
jgi:hypothetical protein